MTSVLQRAAGRSSNQLQRSRMTISGQGHAQVSVFSCSYLSLNLNSLLSVLYVLAGVCTYELVVQGSVAWGFAEDVVIDDQLQTSWPQPTFRGRQRSVLQACYSLKDLHPAKQRVKWTVYERVEQAVRDQ